LKRRYFIVETRVGTGGGERERDLRFAVVRRAVPQFASIGVASNVRRRAKVGFSFFPPSSVAAIVATCRLFRVDRR
jgi:hypothetical protein